MLKCLNWTFYVACLSVVAAGVSSAGTRETTVPKKQGEKYKSAEFRLWTPEGVKVLRGLIIRQHGCGRRGMDHADDLQWQALAVKWDCGLLGSHFLQDKECSDWFDPANGSERAITVALATFAKEMDRPELTQIPWAIWGHSGGALWAMHMANRQPDRTLAVFARSQALTKLSDQPILIPHMLSYGEQEKSGKFEKVHLNAKEAFETYRPLGGLWSIAVDPKSGHDCRNSRQLAIPFFDAILRDRLPEAGSFACKPMGVDDVWLGDLKTLKIARPDDFKGNRTEAAWLPNKAVALAWQEYCKTGEVIDRTSPPAPRSVHVERTGAGNKITWNAVADLESGIQAFRIYRDGKELGRVAAPVEKTNPRGFFQFWNYGDEPEPQAPAFSFTDSSGPVNANYAIETENQQGLRSPRTKSTR